MTNIHFQFFYGINIGFRPKTFLTFFIPIAFFISGTAFVLVMIKKTNERYKERKIIENITINLPSQNPIAKIQFNNLKHNTPLINGFQIIIFAGTVY